MKRITLFLLTLAALILVSGTASSQVVKVFTAKAFATATSRTDTSSTISTKYLPYVEIATSTAGTDSCKIFITVDYKVAGTWILAGKRDTIKYGPATSADKAKGTIVLGPYAASPIPGATDIRVRNTLHPFRTADSTSATSYTQTLLLRGSNFNK
jgi:hypothetical protein